jgi:hypothetical protein
VELVRLPLILILLTMGLASDDTHCPAYPPSERIAAQERLALERLVVHRKDASVKAPPSSNFIDQYIFGKMIQDGVQPAQLSGDTEFQRRVALDLTGRIPSPEEVKNFVADSNPDKRAALIDGLMASDAFVDYWTFFYANQFQVTSQYYNFIGITGRNLFYQYLRDFVAQDRSFAQVASELISGKGDSYQVAPPNFFVRTIQEGDPIQDTWDFGTDQITTAFLGVRSQCISCHNGAGHLEPINLYLSTHKRDQFWRQSAFLSRISLTQLPVDAFSQQWHFVVTDRQAGGYNTAVDPGNPGPRPARSGGPYPAAYLFTGEQPRTSDWRAELARMTTSDRQFARATVNYLWAHFFTYGIVDPPNGWDLARIDPKNPPPAPWTLQPTHPELLEALADEFIKSNYSIRSLIRLMVQSNAYQLSSGYSGDWNPDYERYFAKHFPRRLLAEELYDAMAKATMTETPLNVEGFDRPVTFATQLPDPSEPRTNGPVMDFLTNLGRGDWWQNPRSSDTNVVQVLFLMNGDQTNFRTFASRGVSTSVSHVMQLGLADGDAVNELFLATLGRWATDDELSTLIQRKTSNYEQWLSDIQWALLNKLDFIFNY